jgi:hypothetical protein
MKFISPVLAILLAAASAVYALDECPPLSGDKTSK